MRSSVPFRFSSNYAKAEASCIILEKPVELSSSLIFFTLFMASSNLSKQGFWFV
jgi:hypothetical protein